MKEELTAESISIWFGNQPRNKKYTVNASTCTVIYDGLICGGTLSATPVCPKCALGKQGVVQIMICDVCGAQTAVMR